eukprot:scaffold588112_cov19-Prasinocladus_malaysianus.AAC.1
MAQAWDSSAWGPNKDQLRRCHCLPQLSLLLHEAVAILDALAGLGLFTARCKRCLALRSEGLPGVDSNSDTLL